MNVLDFTIKNLARSLLFALLAQQACLEAEQGKYLCEIQRHWWFQAPRMCSGALGELRADLSP